MSKNSSRPVGRHFLHIPGPTMLPDRVLRAMDTPIIDHRGPEFAKLAKRCLDGIKTIFKTTNPVVIYTATGTGAWEAALVNLLDPGDVILVPGTGQFSRSWAEMARRLGVEAIELPADWRRAADLAAVEAALAHDEEHRIRAVLAVHTETATSTRSVSSSMTLSIRPSSIRGAASGGPGSDHRASTTPSASASQRQRTRNGRCTMVFSQTNRSPRTRPGAVVTAAARRPRTRAGSRGSSRSSPAGA